MAVGKKSVISTSNTIVQWTFILYVITSELLGNAQKPCEKVRQMFNL